MALGEQRCPNRLTEQDLRAMVLVDGLKGLLMSGSSLNIFKLNFAKAYQPQEGEPDQVLLNNVLELMVKNKMLENQDILNVVGAATNLKPQELKGMIKKIQGDVAANLSRQ
ncbi:hypothetical protein KKE75_04405 [Patescibacteria group bacterium]|nr:hypothetical protein [Patescibacteria group bacterium]